MNFLLVVACVCAVHALAELPPVPPLPPNPLVGVVAAQRAFATGAPFRDSGLRRADLLVTLKGVIEWFLPFQNASGAIIDPDHEEEEYSTPCWAHAAATLVTSSGRSDLLAPAMLALNWSIHSLASADCATHTCDFFAVPVMRSVALLSPLVAAPIAASWKAMLSSLTLATWELPGQNWELTAAAGEYDRLVTRGWNDNPSLLNWTFWEGRIGGLITARPSGGYWTPDGIFNDNLRNPGVISPMAYDAFGTSYVAILLSEGYNVSGVYRDYLGPIMSRGVWTHAAYQSPLGEQPVGGRSNQHQFAEATLAAVAELYAGMAADAGDMIGACQLQRVARLYHSSVRRWVREDGALQILKNRFLNYTERFGYMSYSYFSNYNNLPVSWLALAYEFSRDLPECAAPADVGGVAFALTSPTMRKVFASVAGTYVEIIAGADPNYDASGFNRFHVDGCGGGSGTSVPCRLYSLLGPSQAPGLSGNDAVSMEAGGHYPPSAGLSMGPFWTFVGDAPGTRRTLASCTLSSILAVVVTSDSTNSPVNGVAFTVQYVLWSQGVLVTESYMLPPGGGVVNASATLSLESSTALFALMSSAAAAHDGATVFFAPPADATLAAAVAVGDEAVFIAAAPPRELPAGAVFETMGIQFPVFVFDGTTNFTVFPPGVRAPNTIVVQPPSVASNEDGALAFAVEQPNPSALLSWTFDPTDTVVSRNGVLAPVFAQVKTTSNTPRLAYSLSVVPWAAA